MENTNKKTPVLFKRQDVHQLVTDTIIQQLEAGTVPWQKPWSGNDNRLLGLPENFTTGNKYRGINILLLWCSAIKNDFKTTEWASFKQWSDKKEGVRKGEKGSLIVYYDTIEKEVDGKKEIIPFLKSSYVFNRSQLQSYVPPETIENVTKVSFVEKISAVENFVANTKALIEHKDEGAYYRPSDDKIVMPYPELFETSATCTASEGYYSTLFHELNHWTMSKDRMNRIGGKKFGDKNYATEELVAELGAAFLCSGFEISTLDKGNHASYINYWLKALKDNKQCLFTAAKEASKSVEFLQGLQPNFN